MYRPEAICIMRRAVVTGPGTNGRVFGARTKGEMMVGVEAKVKEVLLDVLDIKEDEIVPTARLIDDLKAASIDMVDILAALENAFDVEVDEAQVMKLQTVQDAIDVFKAAIAAKDEAP
jgi:acyl carrier protein